MISYAYLFGQHLAATAQYFGDLYYTARCALLWKWHQNDKVQLVAEIHHNIVIDHAEQSAD